MFKKIVLIFACVFLTIENAHSQDFIQESVGKTDKKIKKKSSVDSLFVPIDEWKGKEVIFLPKSKSLQQFGYSVYESKENMYGDKTSYDKLVGKIATVTSIEEAPAMDIMTLELKNGKKYYAGIYQKTFSDVALLRDLKIAREKFLGDTLYYVGSYRGENFDLVLNTYNSENNEFGEVPVSKLEALKVKNIVAAWDGGSPVRFILEKKNGEIGFIDVNLTGTNTSISGRYRSRFNDHFSEVNPKKIYNWSTNVWSAISEGEPMIGMNKEQLIMAIGKPNSINNTIVRGSKREQWIYKNRSFSGYVYFDNGKLSGIQN